MSLPQSEPSVRIAKLFKRRLTTHWSKPEAKLFRDLVKARTFETKIDGKWVPDMSDLTLVELYYEAERKKGDGPRGGIHRRDLKTFLYNFQAEVDRARAWAEKNPQAADKAKERADRGIKVQPARWYQFLEAVYPEARERNYWKAPQSVQEEFRAWEKIYEQTKTRIQGR